MDIREFDTFAARIIPQYADAKVRAGEWERDTAGELSRADFHARLPTGLSTPGHKLLSIRDTATDRPVGNLWLEFRTEAGQLVCAVLDVFVEAAERRRGYANGALLAAESIARQNGAKSMRLTVFGCNPAAQALYVNLQYYLLNARLEKAMS